MKSLISLLMLPLCLSILLPGCATTTGTAAAPVFTPMTQEMMLASRDPDVDWAYVDRVNVLSRAMGVSVIWKELPYLKDKRPAPKKS